MLVAAPIGQVCLRVFLPAHGDKVFDVDTSLVSTCVMEDVMSWVVPFQQPVCCNVCSVVVLVTQCHDVVPSFVGR